MNVIENWQQIRIKEKGNDCRFCQIIALSHIIENRLQEMRYENISWPPSRLVLFLNR